MIVKSISVLGFSIFLIALVSGYTATPYGGHGVSELHSESLIGKAVARGYIIDTIPSNQGSRIGVIGLPAFYSTYSKLRSNQGSLTSARDTRKIITKFNKEGVSGIVLDLRGNKGGPLSEAVEVAGLFIKSGGIVQIKDATGELEIKSDSDPDIAYVGPLAVLVDHESAAASEIVAAAIQDYKRGIIVGEQTFGSGSIRTIVDLGRFVQGGASLGHLNLTFAMFFRPEGSGIQQHGVEPDVVFPTDSDTFPRERTKANSLPWGRVDHLEIPDYGFKMSSQVLKQHVKRTRSDSRFNAYIDLNRLSISINEMKTISLNESQRRIDKQLLDQKYAKILKRLKGGNEAIDMGTLAEVSRKVALMETIVILTDCIKAKCYQDRVR